MKEVEYKEILAAALFHDIGKLVFRAESSTGKSQNHSQLGEFFYNEYLAKITAFKELKNISNMILTHHDSGGSKNAIISEADHISAGERYTSDSAFTLSPLISVFDTLDSKKKKTGEAYYYTPSVLSEKSLYPESKAESELEKNKKELSEQYQKVLESLQRDLSALIDIYDFDAAVDSVLSVFEKHLSLIPSAGYKSIPDVCLYDHMRMTSAIASCLYMADNLEEPFMLIEGDLSGIQEYIYSINNGNHQKNMAKRLRGRSFELVLITDAVIAFMLKSLGLNRVHVVYSGGGNFILLAPSTEKNRKALSEAGNSINRMLSERYKGRISLVLAHLSLKKDDVTDFSKSSFKLKNKIADNKKKKFQSIFSKEFFGPHNFSEDASDICPICGRDFEKGSGETCSHCHSQVLLGEKLVSSGKNSGRAGIVRIYTDKNVELSGVDLGFPELGIHYILFSGRDFIADIPEAKRLDYLSLNSTEYNFKALSHGKSCPVACSLMFAGTYVPTDANGVIKSFEDMALSRADAYSNIGIIRLDVDDLGYIFSFAGAKTISRFATLSRSMNNFFLWCINYIAEEHNIYITYSGGDDLFAVGNWKDLIDFSIEIHNKFSKFTCFNDIFHISAGIGVFRPNYPIRHGAEATGELESLSKGKWFDNKVGKACEKDSVTLFGATISWQRLKELHKLSNDIYEHLEENPKSNVNDGKAKIKASLIYKIYSMVASAKKKGNREWVFSLRYIIKYILSRRGMGYSFMERSNLTGELAKKQEIVKQIIREDILKDFSVPGSIVIYSARKK